MGRLRTGQFPEHLHPVQAAGGRRGGGRSAQLPAGGLGHGRHARHAGAAGRAGLSCRKRLRPAPRQQARSACRPPCHFPLQRTAHGVCLPLGRRRSIRAMAVQPVGGNGGFCSGSAAGPAEFGPAGSGCTAAGPARGRRVLGLALRLGPPRSVPAQAGRPRSVCAAGGPAHHGRNRSAGHRREFLAARGPGAQPRSAPPGRAWGGNGRPGPAHGRLGLLLCHRLRPGAGLSRLAGPGPRRRARRPVGRGPRDLERAAAADPLAAEPHWQLAAAFLEDWLARPNNRCYRRFEEEDAAALRLAPNSASGWLASGDRYERAYRKKDRQGRPLQPEAIQEAVLRYGRAVASIPPAPYAGHAWHWPGRKKGTGTLAATFLPLPNQLPPRSQSPFSADPAQQDWWANLFLRCPLRHQHDLPGEHALACGSCWLPGADGLRRPRESFITRSICGRQLCRGPASG